MGRYQIVAVWAGMIKYKAVLSFSTGSFIIILQ
jgi:hypothetical protein